MRKLIDELLRVYPNIPKEDMEQIVLKSHSKGSYRVAVRAGLIPKDLQIED